MKSLQVIRGSSTPLLQLLLLLLTGVCIEAYKPVVIVHGIFDGPKEFINMSQYITKVHPGTEVHVIDRYNYEDSVAPLWTQVQDIRKDINDIMETPQAKDGIHLLCYSQGGLICRAILSTAPKHNVHSFISLSSPQAGQYGDTEYMNKILPEWAKQFVYLICYYTTWGQSKSVCHYWNDPHERSSYLQNNIFLPLLNGDKPHDKMKSWRENFLRIKKLVLIGGPDDDVITPWESSKFGFYDSDEKVVPMRNQDFYKDDTFGLKTLSDRGDISVCVQSGVKHVYWHNNFTVFRNCIEKWLI